MKLRSRPLATVLGLAMMAAWCVLPLSAEEPGPSPSPTPKDGTPSAPAVRKGDPSRRLPNYYGQVGLSLEQRESIYKIVGTHQKKIEALQKQIAETRAGMLKECEAILTAPQKQLLEQRRRVSSRDQASSAPTETHSNPPAPSH